MMQKASEGENCFQETQNSGRSSVACTHGWCWRQNCWAWIAADEHYILCHSAAAAHRDNMLIKMLSWPVFFFWVGGLRPNTVISKKSHLHLCLKQSRCVSVCVCVSLREKISCMDGLSSFRFSVLLYFTLIQLVLMDPTKLMGVMQQGHTHTHTHTHIHLCRDTHAHI